MAHIESRLWERESHEPLTCEVCHGSGEVVRYGTSQHASSPPERYERCGCIDGHEPCAYCEARPATGTHNGTPICAVCKEDDPS